jgi:hypothetical protein
VITGSQIRKARELLGWPAVELARRVSDERRLWASEQIPSFERAWPSVLGRRPSGFIEPATAMMSVHPIPSGIPDGP